MPDLKGVEIFAEGTWNGNSITGSVLTNIVHAFEATKTHIKPPLKLGHNPEQDLLRNDGLPAAGWVSNVYIQGKKLLADFVDIPQKVYELIKKKAYRKVSVEIFSGYTFNGKTYPSLLGAVALLGADTPAVMTLSDILGRYSLDVKNFTNDLQSDKIDIKIFTKYLEEEDTMTDKVLSEKEISDRINAEVDKKLATFQVSLDKATKENEDLKTNFTKYKEDSEKKIVTLESQKTDAEIDKFTLDLKSKSLLSPSMSPYVKALVGSTSKLEFSVGDKKITSQEAIEELLKLAKSVYSVNKEEKTEDLEVDQKNTIKDFEKKIDEYMTTHKVSYSHAYRQIMKQSK